MDSLLNEYLGSGQLSLSLIIPIVTVLVGAVLVFVCGIHKPKEPQFRKIAASVESGSKKIRRKDKQPSTSSTSTKASAQNGSVKQSQSVAASGKKQSTPAVSKKEKPLAEEESPKRKEAVAATKKTATKASTSAKATAKKSPKVKAEKAAKPNDFDDGGWTTVQSRTDKKKKQDDLPLMQSLDAVLSQSTSKKSTITGNNKTDAKSTTKNAKQLKDQVNKSKKEAAEINKKNKKNAAAPVVDNEQVNNKVADTIENLVNELKKDGGEFVKQQQPKIVEAIDSGLAEEKSDDSKPVAGGGVVFNEMPDTWTEAKAPKKGKKKPRKD